MATMTPQEAAVLDAALAWHAARYPDLNVDTAFDTSDHLHEAIERLTAPRVWYRCSICHWTDDAHPFDVCNGGEWLQETTPART